MTFVPQKIDFPRGHGPWKILGRNTWTGKYGLKVHRDSVIGPDGKEGIYEWAEPKMGASILPMDSADNIYLARTFSYAGGIEGLFAPGGGIEKTDSSHRETAVREMAEELGITSNKITYVGLFRPIPGVIHCPQYMYIAEGINFGEGNPEPTERIKLVKMPLEEAVQKVLDPKQDTFDGQTEWVIMKAYLLGK